MAVEAKDAQETIELLKPQQADQLLYLYRLPVGLSRRRQSVSDRLQYGAHVSGLFNRKQIRR
ncbi:hypothetical protein [Bacillus haynesii]|uniref:hypothetical protein n=1 Tax=Bacillus haynesii TaxID=1925021 RepID=UPI002280F51E|nr:hypothetical protein [Bacillus haynesii]MCY7770666.1 hypothetical protein [Bacillus haynesii]MCY8001433.1 hypothetical protein [Bacillus haynesii]MCY8012199.1 hypothetical protein [Bacillus haynesii]MCY8347786.1 hypothetical protein [Bacillus haynesii]MCY8561142.1 hypothetical protein [Bacillus haynesii]